VLDACAAAEATALLVHSDREAISLVEQAQERGMRVPADLAVIAYDDEVAALADPPLTAVRPPRAAIGASAVELLTRRLGITRADGDSTRDGVGAGSDPATGADRPVHRVELSPHLIVRASTAPRV
jgi:DNA-binding LacI/PurR family transcriptional regulator